MKPFTFLTLGLAIAAPMVAPAGALAAPDHTGKLSATSTSFKWDGQIGVGVTMVDTLKDSPLPCGSPGHECDDTLIQVETPGKLTVKTSSSDPLAPDLDLYVYTSDASGTRGKEKGKSAQSSPTPNEQVAFTVDAPGYYLVEADYTIMLGGTFQGEATLQPGEGIEAAIAPTVKIISPKKSVKSSKFKSISGTAADDTAVSKVEVAVVSGKGSKCKSLTSKGSFAKSSCTAPKFLAAKGTTKWSYKLKKKIKKGTYVVLARATDDGGATQTSKTSVKVS